MDMFAFAAFASAAAAAAYVGVSLYRIGPQRILFQAGYSMYTSRVGLFLHKRGLAKEKKPHSIVRPFENQHVTVIPLAILSDNYSYLVIDNGTESAVVVDPADPDVIEAAITELKVHLRAILTTHKHWDHAGGNERLLERFPKCAVFGSQRDQVSGLTHNVDDGDFISILGSNIQVSKSNLHSSTEQGLHFSVVSTPGHTVGHLAYVLEGEPKSVFTGDCVFIAGCGRLFEGTPAEMMNSIGKLAQLPSSTLVWPGHEYTHTNARFTAQLEPDNEHVRKLLEESKVASSEKTATIPSTIDLELQHNPFFRSRLGIYDHLPSISSLFSTLTTLSNSHQSLSEKTENLPYIPLEMLEKRSKIFGEIRSAKDKFK